MEVACVETIFTQCLARYEVYIPRVSAHAMLLAACASHALSMSPQDFLWWIWLARRAFITRDPRHVLVSH
jgi:hypothetical protein